jgi:hypothetical protein
MIPGAVMVRRFRARANMGHAEFARRVAAVAAGAPMTVLPPPLGPAPDPAAEAEAVLEPAPAPVPSVAAGEPESLDIPAGGIPVYGARAGGDARRDRPVVTIAISGPARGGKSVVAHAIRAALAGRGIVVEGPPGLRSLDLNRALRSLVDRGLSVEIVAGSVPGIVSGADGEEAGDAG